MFTRLTVNTWMNCRQQQKQRLKIVCMLNMSPKHVSLIYLLRTKCLKIFQRQELQKEANVFGKPGCGIELWVAGVIASRHVGWNDKTEIPVFAEVGQRGNKKKCVSCYLRSGKS